MTDDAADGLTTAFYVALLAWAVALASLATGWSSWRDQLFPLLVVVPTAFLVAVQLARIGRARLGTDDSRSSAGEDGEDSDAGLARLAVVFGWVAAFPVAVYYLGFVVSIPAFLFGFAGYLLGDWKRAAKIAVLVTACVVVLFVSILEVRLWAGVLEPLSWTVGVP